MFPRYARVRPGRAVSLAGAVVGLIILVIAGNNGAPPVFLIVALVVIALNLFNAVGPGVTTEIIDFGDDNNRGSTGPYCTACGTAMPPGAAFCPHCGHRLGA